MSKSVAWAIRFLSVTAVYITAGKLGLHVAVLNPSATAVWLPTGVALAALLQFGVMLWPAVFVAAFVVNVTTAGGALPSILIAAGNTGEAVAGWYLVSRLAGGHVFDRATGVIRFAAYGAVLSTTISATVGVMTLESFGLASWPDFRSVWLTWWLGDLSGALIGAPVLLLWAQSHPTYTSRQLVELVALTASLIVSGHLVLHGDVQQWKFVCLPLLIWPAVRFGQRETAAAVLLLASLALFDNLTSFGGRLTREHEVSLVLMQVFMATMSLVALTLGATFTERRRANEALSRHLATLEERIAERTRELRVSEASLSDLSARLLQMQDLERRRLSRTLHEGAAQDVAGVSLHLALAQRSLESSSPEAREALAASLRLADHAVGHIRELAMSVHPPVLDDLGLAAAIRWYAGGVARERGVPLDLDLPDHDDEWIPLGTEIMVFRIVQECLTNPQLHGRSAAVRIQLATAGAGLALAVEGALRGDDEALTATEAAAADVGIRGLRERVRQLGGQLAIDTDPERVRVSLRLPPDRLSV